jgi:GTP cyclohydrolase FolE2
MSEIPNIQDEEAEIPIPIDMVGFKNIRMPAGRIFLNGLEIIIVPRFDVYVDLPVE